MSNSGKISGKTDNTKSIEITYSDMFKKSSKLAQLISIAKNFKHKKSSVFSKNKQLVSKLIRKKKKVSIKGEKIKNFTNYSKNKKEHSKKNIQNKISKKRQNKIGVKKVPLLKIPEKTVDL